MPTEGFRTEPIVSIPLYNEEAEMSVLGALLIDKDVIGEVLNIVIEDDFYREPNRLIFRCIKDLYMRGQPVDVVTVTAQLERLGVLDQVGDREYIASILELLPSTSSAVYYSKIVKDRSISRGLVRMCQGVIEDIQGSGKSVAQLLEDAQAKIYRLAESRVAKDVVKIGDVINEVWAHISENRDRSAGIIGVPTGFFRLDEFLAGLQRGNLYIVAARPGMGKSSLAMRIAENVSLIERIPVLFFTLEMPAETLVQQMLCSHCRVDSHRLRSGILSDDDIMKLGVGANKLRQDAQIFLDDSSDLSVFELRARARRFKHEHNIGLVIVDYLQKLSAKPADSRQSEITVISSQLKALSKELSLPVIAIAQLNRAPDAREDKKPFLSDLRESGSIELDADVVLMLYREEYYNPNTENKNICEVTVAKNRTGPTGQFNLVFLKEFTRFENPAFT